VLHRCPSSQGSAQSYTAIVAVLGVRDQSYPSSLGRHDARLTMLDPHLQATVELDAGISPADRHRVPGVCTTTSSWRRPSGPDQASDQRRHSADFRLLEALPSTPIRRRGLLSMVLHPNFPGYAVLPSFAGRRAAPAWDTATVGDVPLTGNRVDRFIWDGSILTFDRKPDLLRSRQNRQHGRARSSRHQQRR